MTLLHCSPSPATPCLTTLTGPCGLRGRTSVFLYQERAGQVKPKPPRRSSSTTRSPAPPMSVWLPSESAYYSLTLFWRYFSLHFLFLFITFTHSTALYMIILVYCLIIGILKHFTFSASLHHCLLCAGIRQCQNSEKWQLQPLWKIHGYPVWLQGENFLTSLLFRRCLCFVTPILTVQFYHPTKDWTKKPRTSQLSYLSAVLKS